MIVFDLTSPKTFQKAVEWIEELHKNADANIVIALVGNKLDLIQDRKILKEEALKFAEENGLFYYECSAKTGENVSDIFIDVMLKIPVFEKSNFSGIDSSSLLEVNVQTGLKKRLCC